jgi:hypothetical protein
MPELPSLDEECFFIAPIGKEGSPERKRSDGVLEFIVSRAAQEVGLRAVRADKIAEPGQITLQVIEHVLGARAAVVDLTGLNPNVFYELAVRHTARLPVALIAEKDCSLPFDIAQMRTIFFDHTDLQSADECRRDIAAHLREALENGAVDSPIATTVDVRTLQAGSVVERNVADLVTTVEEMAKSQRTTLAALDRIRLDVRRYRGDISPAAINDLVRSIQRVQQSVESGEYAGLRELIVEVERPLRYIERHLSPPYFDTDLSPRRFTPRPPTAELNSPEAPEPEADA